MEQTSEWLGYDELFEISEEGVISLLYKELNFISMLEITRIDITCGHEKNLIINAKEDFKSLLLNINDEANFYFFTEEECQEMMEKIYITVKTIIEFTDLEFLN